MIIFGGKTSNIGNFDIPNTKCNYCKQESSQRISVLGKYAHIFWIPIFPIGKKVIAECKHCKRTIQLKEFPLKLVKLYDANRSKTKRPIWHWFGLGLFSLFVLFIILIISTADVDPRNELLQSDIRSMISNPTMEKDSISFKIKQIFDNFAVDDINSSQFEYLTKIVDNKALILVKIPKLRHVEKDARNQALEMIELITDNQLDLMDKEKYIGVHGMISMMIIKTPNYEENSKLAYTHELYEFYGPKPETDK